MVYPHPQKALHEKKMRSKAEDFELLQQRRQQAEKEKKLWVAWV